MGEPITVVQLMWPLILIMAGFLVGLLIELIIPLTAKRIGAGTSWEAAGQDLRVLRGVVVLWTTMAGIYFALDYVSINLRILGIAHQAMCVTVILSVGFVVGQFAVAAIRVRAQKADGAARATSILTNITRLIILLVAALIALDSLGISIVPALTALGVAGLAVALALQSTLANLFAGLQLLASKQVRPGDYIRLDSGEEGHVLDITWRTTMLRNPQGMLIVVPNSKVASVSITNYSLPERKVVVTVPIALKAEADLFAVERAATEIAREVMKDIPGCEPRIHYSGVNVAAPSLTVVLCAKDVTDLQRVREEFVRRMTEQLKKD